MNHRIIDVALAVIKDEQGRYLVAQRPVTTDHAGYWEFPGGKREAGESRLQALKRECSEELGIKVQHARPLFRWVYEYRKLEGASVEAAPGHSDRHVRLDAWLIDDYSGEAHGAEGQQVRWLSANEFSDYRFLQANKILMKVLALPAYYAITPEIDMVEGFYSQLDTLFAQNVSLLQFRAKNLSPAEYKIHASRLMQYSASHDMTIMLNAEPAWVATLGGDTGLHLTSQRLMHLDQRPIADNRWLSASCHNVEQLRQAEHIACDFVVLSPVLPTQSHPHAATLGWEALECLVSNTNIPVYALGGMTKAHLDQTQQLGCQGIAGISMFWGESND